MIRAAVETDLEAIVRINRAGRPGVAALERADLQAILASDGELLVHIEAGHCLGYAITYTDEVDYDGEEFAWFRRHISGGFLYVDQIAIAPEAQGRGIGRSIYDALVDRAGAAGIEHLACEVNMAPPNPGSLAFHTRMGFETVGEMQTVDGRQVRLLDRLLA